MQNGASQHEASDGFLPYNKEETQAKATVIKGTETKKEMVRTIFQDRT